MWADADGDGDGLGDGDPDGATLRLTVPVLDETPWLSVARNGKLSGPA